jgi:hypothetical protein
MGNETRKVRYREHWLVGKRSGPEAQIPETPEHLAETIARLDRAIERWEWEEDLCRLAERIVSSRRLKGELLEWAQEANDRGLRCRDERLAKEEELRSMSR